MATSGDAWIEQWLSKDRFALYVRKAGGDRTRALELYEWNAKLSAAFLHDLNHLEVALRNTYDQQLVHATLHGDRHWTDRKTVQHLFPKHMRMDQRTGKQVDANRTPRDQIGYARSAAGATPNPGKVVAELMFGFWTYMTSDLHEKTLWVPHLHKAFPQNTDRSKVHDTLTALRKFRNRVAHHEPILTAPEARRRQLVSAMRLIRPEALAHFNAHSEVSAILAKRP
ncbi:Abi family protein [Rhodococcus sp. NPDC003382]